VGDLFDGSIGSTTICNKFVVDKECLGEVEQRKNPENMTLDLRNRRQLKRSCWQVSADKNMRFDANVELDQRQQD
jgi:hypothetical protein